LVSVILGNNRVGGGWRADGQTRRHRTGKYKPIGGAGHIDGGVAVGHDITRLAGPRGHHAHVVERVVVGQGEAESGAQLGVVGALR